MILRALDRWKLIWESQVSLLCNDQSIIPGFYQNAMDYWLLGRHLLKVSDNSPCNSDIPSGRLKFDSNDMEYVHDLLQNLRI